MLKDISEILFVLVKWDVLTCRTSWQARIIGAKEDGLYNGDELDMCWNAVLSLP